MVGTAQHRLKIVHPTGCGRMALVLAITQGDIAGNQSNNGWMLLSERRRVHRQRNNENAIGAHPASRSGIFIPGTAAPDRTLREGSSEFLSCTTQETRDVLQLLAMARCD
jgi:hypothetical protein